MNLDGGINDVSVPGLAGRLWLCGKHVIGPDVEATMLRVAADHVVCLVREHELEGRYDQYVEWLKIETRQTETRATWYPIHDLSSPPLAEILPLYRDVADRVRSGETVVAHCAAGIGRAGTLAVAVCQLLGMNLETALTHVRLHRPGAGPEVGTQLDAVTELATLLDR